MTSWQYERCEQGGKLATLLTRNIDPTNHGGYPMKKLISLSLIFFALVVASGCAALTQDSTQAGSKYKPLEHRDAAGHYR
jgi:hypothetical protein